MGSAAKLHLAAIFEEELQVLGVQAELPERTADLVRGRPVGGRFRPTVRPARVFEFQCAAVTEQQKRPIELGIDYVTRRFLSSEFTKHVRKFYKTRS